MKVKKFTLYLLLLSLCAGPLFSQSLVELAQKEKERREKLKGKKVKVVTNADLKNLKIRPAVSIREEVMPEQELSPSPATSLPENNPPQTITEPETEEEKKEDDLEERWQKAQERVAQLESQLNALWEQYHSPESVVPKEYLQQQISLTYLQLQQAQQEEDELKRQLDMAVEEKKN